MALSSRSMFVSLNLRMWTANAADRSIAMRVEKDTEAQNNTMRVVKQLVPSEYTLPIKRLAIYGREQHERLTLPGLVKGQQLLATKLFDEYAYAQQEIKEAFETEVKRFVEEYPTIMMGAPIRLGKAFREHDFPTQQEISSYFSYNIRFTPVPDAGNWLLDDVDHEDLDKLRNQVENEKNNMFRDAMKDLMERSRSVLQNLKMQADTYTDGQANGGILREPTIDAVKDMARLISSMNITGDPMLDAIGREMQTEFATMEAKELRHNATTRNRIAEVAARILKKME